MPDTKGVVVRNYVSWQDGNNSVPLAEGNSDYQRIRAGLADGTYVEREPTINVAFPIRESGNVTGWDTNLGFVADDPTNHLRSLLAAAFVAGLKETELPPATDQPLVEAIVLCVIFDRPWRYLGNPVSRLFQYRSSGASKELELKATVRNLPSPSKLSAEAELLAEYGAATNMFAPSHAPVQFGTLEIEIPVQFMQRLLRTELTHLDQWTAEVIRDSIDEHLARSGRSSPERLFVIGMAHMFLGRMAARLGNVVVREFSLESGGAPPGHIKPQALQEGRILLVQKLAGGTARWGGSNNPKWRDYKFPDVWPQRSEDLQARGHQAHVIRRVEQMMDAGFYMEGLVLLTYLEVFVKEALTRAAVIPNTRASLVCMGHGARLDLLKCLAALSALRSDVRTLISETAQRCASVYSLRNDYVHSLVLPDDQEWPTQEIELQVADMVQFFTAFPGNQLSVLEWGLDESAVRNEIEQFTARWARRSAAN